MFMNRVTQIILKLDTFLKQDKDRLTYEPIPLLGKRDTRFLYFLLTCQKPVLSEPIRSIVPSSLSFFKRRFAVAILKFIF